MKSLISVDVGSNGITKNLATLFHLVASSDLSALSIGNYEQSNKNRFTSNSDCHSDSAKCTHGHVSQALQALTAMLSQNNALSLLNFKDVGLGNQGLEAIKRAKATQLVSLNLNQNSITNVTSSTFADMVNL